MPSRLWSAKLWKLSTIAFHWVEVPPAPFGPPPPPLRTEPSPYVAMSWLPFRYVFATCVICPAFSASVIFERQSLVEMQPAVVRDVRADPSELLTSTASATRTPRTSPRRRAEA